MIQIALAYKVPRVSSFIEEDYKLIRKIQILLTRLEKSGKDILILEIFNILRTLNNIFDMNKLYLVLCSEVEFKYHSTLAYLIEELDSLDSDVIIKKFKEIDYEI